MHRSGTSLATHLLSELGYVAAGELMPAHADNPHGFWEHQEITQTHEAFLERLGRNWTDPTPLPAAAFTSDAAGWARDELRGHFERDLLPQARWVLKDPRLCRLLPLWEPLLDHDALDVRYLLVLRSPAAVAASLAHRNGLPPAHSLLLWLIHSLEAERRTRQRPRYWFDFDRFTGSPETVCAGLVTWLAEDGITPAAIGTEVLETTYDPDLVHHGAETDEEITRMSAEPWIAETHAALTTLAASDAEEPEALATLDAVHAEVVRAGSFLDRPLDRDRIARERQRTIARLQREKEVAERGIDTLRHRQERLEATLGQVFASRSWRWTKPLRRDKKR